MLLVTIPPFASELVAALVGAVAALAAIRRKRAAHDPEAEIRKLTERVRFQANHPVRSLFARLFRA
jgi:hypothetical protein